MEQIYKYHKHNIYIVSICLFSESKQNMNQSANISEIEWVKYFLYKVNEK